MPQVSVIVPVYNAEKYIERCVNSILSQTFTDFELILVDDGSSDNSGDICDALKQTDDRIYVIHKANGGASSARNEGISAAKGNYICFIDADDYVTQYYLSCMVDNSDCDIDLVMQGLIKNNAKETLGFEQNENFNIDNYCQFFDKYNLFRFCGSYCKLFRRGIIEKYGVYYCTNVICAEDYDFLLRYLVCCGKIRIIKDCNYFYMSHSGSVSTRIYSFDKEYIALKQIKHSMDNFVVKVGTESLMKQQKYLISYYIQRVLFSNYHTSYTKKQRMANFKSIDDSFLLYYRLYYKPETCFLRIVKWLFVNKKFGVLDLLMKMAV